MWASDLSPYSTNSVASRWPIAIVPASRYVVEAGVNLTLQALTAEITKSFNQLSSSGIKLRNYKSMGGGTEFWSKLGIV